MNKAQRYLLPVIVAGVALADLRINGPIAGYVTDSSSVQLRAILGVPGAFAFSEPLALPEGVTRVHLAPGQDFALVERSSGAPGVLFLRGSAVDHMSPIDGAIASTDWIAFSNGARSALLFSGGKRLQVLSGLPAEPRVSLDLDAMTLPEQPKTGAISDDGNLVLVASATSVYRVSRDSAAQLVLSAGEVRSLTVLRNGSDAAVTDGIADSIQVVRNAASNPEVGLVASGLDGIGSIYPSSDGLSLFVARPGAQAVSAVDLVSGEVQSFAVSATSMGLAPLRNRDAFLISAQSQQPGWVFFRNGKADKVVFIPAIKTATTEVPANGGVQ